ncbi:calcium binding EGF domain protein [Teladorsagia circumcincta]|uniref:Calcium binding EGF domain protein n=1 Tax=Teladorsagia circumcincta TaxID=45464 RepID=A0A2G9U369_TELCI|nr:calcium binding EGF domain protein [Teladorsagia circumcincta]
MLLLVVALVRLTSCEHDASWNSRGSFPPNEPKSLVKRAAAVDLCQMPPDIGSCSRELIRYYYDPKDDECKRFTYSKGTPFFPTDLNFGRVNHSQFRLESKQRRMLSSTVSTTVATTTSQTKVPATRPPKKINVTKATPNIRDCPLCDPLFGVCIDGECGCMDGFRKLGKICIDINECEKVSTCPANSRCINTVGSYKCECDAGFNDDGRCVVEKGACADVFDVRYTEEDCNHGVQELRFYYDQETNICRQFFYGGCVGKSKNIFVDAKVEIEDHLGFA